MNSSKHSDDLALDNEQMRAVEAPESAIAVLAGPGSGKTRALSMRTRHLLSQDTESAALLLTFTNKAAAEMKARALGFAGVASTRLSASTFHTFCQDVLRSHGDLVGVPRDFEILESRDALDFAKEVMEKSGLGNYYDRWSYIRLRQKQPGIDVLAFGQAYQAAKIAASVLDFDDLVVYVSELFESRADVVQAYAERYVHILIDEFQDTNAVQATIVAALAKNAKTISMFADDDQAIFGFAGAEAANIKKFITATGAKVYPLTMNYRCTGEVVDVANKLIAASPSSSGRIMKSSKTGGAVRLSTFDTVDKEATEIGAEIAGWIAKGLPTSSLAVLVRSGRRANALVEELKRRGLPVSDWRGETHTPQSRRVMASCLATVRGSLNARQTRVLCGLVGAEPCGAADTEEFLEKHSFAPLCKGLNRMRDLVFAGSTPHDIARAAQQAVTDQNASCGSQLTELVESVANFQLYDKDFTLEHLLSELALGALGRAPAEGGGIKVASLHRTKGLQWRVVYLLGLEEGHHPDFRAKTAQDIDEERRLCFVGISRAEQTLVFTRCKITSRHVQTPSRFLLEMGLIQ